MAKEQSKKPESSIVQKDESMSLLNNTVRLSRLSLKGIFMQGIIFIKIKVL